MIPTAVIEHLTAEKTDRFNRPPLKAMDRPWLAMIDGVVVLSDLSYEIDYDNVLANGDTENVMLFDLNADLKGSINKFREICVQHHIPTITCSSAIDFPEEEGVAQEKMDAFLSRYMH